MEVNFDEPVREHPDYKCLYNWRKLLGDVVFASTKFRYDPKIPIEQQDVTLYGFFTFLPRMDDIQTIDDLVITLEKLEEMDDNERKELVRKQQEFRQHPDVLYLAHQRLMRGCVHYYSGSGNHEGPHIYGAPWLGNIKKSADISKELSKERYLSQPSTRVNKL